jgi:RNA polymerase sigma factor (sigma-70 family)
MDYNDDLTLARLVARGDQDAWDRFVDQYSNIIFSIARRFSKDYDTMMDIYLYVLQSLRDRGFKKLKAYNGQSKLSTYLVVVTRNLCIDHYRSKKGRNRQYKAIAHLSPADQLLFRLYHQNGFSINEAYEIMRTNYRLDISPTDISRSLKRIEGNLTRKKLWQLQNDLKTEVALPLNDAMLDEQAGKETDDPAHNLIKKESERTLTEASAALSRIIDTLPREDKLIIKLMFHEQLTAKEVARLTGLPNEQAVYTQCRRMLKQFKEELKKSGFTENAFQKLAKTLPR